VVLLGAVRLESDASFGPELAVGVVGSCTVILVDQVGRDWLPTPFAAQASNFTARHARGQMCLTHA
jgi:hypothetical protein